MFQFDRTRLASMAPGQFFLRTAPVLSSSPVGYPVSSSACRSSALQLSPFGMGNEILHSLKLTFSPLKMVVSNRNLLFRLFSGAFAVSLREGSSTRNCTTAILDHSRCTVPIEGNLRL